MTLTIRRRDRDERIDGRAPLYVEFYLMREKVRIPTRISVERERWDEEKQKVLGRTDDARDMNLVLADIKARINEVMVRSRLAGEALTKPMFLKLYKEPRTKSKSFIKFCEAYLKEMSPAMQPQTIKNHKTAIFKLKNYAPRLTAGQITADFLRQYAAYLKKFYGNNPGTVRKNINTIRTYYYAAVRKNLAKASPNPFLGLKLPKSTEPMVYLTEEELGRLVSLYKSDRLKESEQNVLRFFLFMIYTGMHISDAKAIQMEQIFANEIFYYRQKTGTKVTLPLSEPAKKLVQYYKEGRRRGLLIRDVPTDQAFNRIIKRVCFDVGITKNVSAKTGRHTFATLYLAKNPGDILTLSKLLGHTSINTTMVYTHVLQSSKISGISIFDEMF